MNLKTGQRASGKTHRGQAFGACFLGVFVSEIAIKTANQSEERECFPMMASITVMISGVRKAGFLPLLESSLRTLGAKTRLVSGNGTELLNAVLKYHPTVVLLDATLQSPSAREVMGRVREHYPTQTPQFISFSANDSPLLQQEMRAAGAESHLLLPFDCQVVARRLLSLACKSVIQQQSTGRYSTLLEMQVGEVLRELSVPVHLYGYYYVKDAIVSSVLDPQVVCLVTKHLYPDVALLHRSTAARVERDIRNAISHAWESGWTKSWERYFGILSAKPTNRAFIRGIADVVRREYQLAK